MQLSGVKKRVGQRARRKQRLQTAKAEDAMLDDAVARAEAERGGAGMPTQHEVEQEDAWRAEDVRMLEGDLDARVDDAAAKLVAARGRVTANDLVWAIKQARACGDEELAWGLELRVRVLVGRP
eukprot:10471283-Prorocentrum_lima.AAC.1